MGDKMFALEDTVEVKLNKVQGTVKGIAQYSNHPEQIQVYHIDGHGDAVYNWYNHYDLEIVNS